MLQRTIRLNGSAAAPSPPALSTASSSIARASRRPRTAYSAFTTSGLMLSTESASQVCDDPDDEFCAVAAEIIAARRAMTRDRRSIIVGGISSIGV